MTNSPAYRAAIAEALLSGRMVTAVMKHFGARHDLVKAVGELYGMTFKRGARDYWYDGFCPRCGQKSAYVSGLHWERIEWYDLCPDCRWELAHGQTYTRGELAPEVLARVLGEMKQWPE